MKTNRNKKTLWQFILSITALGFFVLLLIGQADYQPEPTIKEISKGVFQEKYYVGRHEVSTTGPRDWEGQWHGMVTIKNGNKGFTEVVEMVHGKRHGKALMTYDDGTKDSCEYSMGEFVRLLKTTAYADMADNSAFQILGKYPWFMFALNAFGFDDVYIEAFMDTLETVLNTYEFEEAEFHDYMDDALDELDDTPYDSIININADMSMAQGLENLRGDQFRLAVIKRHRSDGSTTYDVVQTTYPGYLLSMNEAGVNDQDFEAFCQDVDSCMDSYGPLDPDDAYFIDSIDTRIYRTLIYFSSMMEDTSSSRKSSLKSIALAYKNNELVTTYRFIKARLKSLFFQSTPTDVATAVAYNMLIQYIEGDIIRKAVKESWCITNGIVRIPTVVTVFSGSSSSSGATIQGNVIEDGGAAVTSRGMAWAEFYNPTVDANSISSGSGTGSYSVTLTGLVTGQTYYARAWAVNSADTAYGNCISFIAGDATGIVDNDIFKGDLFIYPNPVSTIATVRFQLEMPGNMVLYIYDMKGQVASYNDLGYRLQGKNQIRLDLSGLQNGVYMCYLTNGTAKTTSRFVVAR
ncbi:MAG: T9SS type A sorting domain-containing protein [Bacteroidales bacterium]|nr:T9SS type A sorting domain-containing protein [Bacteroidales bacterium]